MDPEKPTTTSVITTGLENERPGSSPAEGLTEKGIKDIESQSGELEQETSSQHDKYLVDWDGPDDQENPLNWTPKKKSANIAVLSCLTFTSPLASSMFAPVSHWSCRNFRVTIFYWHPLWSLYISLDTRLGMWS